MKTYKLFVLVLLLLFAVTATGCSLTAKLKKPQEESVGSDTSNTLVKTSLKDLLASGSSQKCTWSTTEDGVAEGEIYFSGKKFYQETTVTGKKVYAISDGNVIYTYFDGMNSGFKMAMDYDNLKELSEKSAGTENNMPVDFEKNFDYKCSAWRADPAKFTPPANIQFQDLSALMEGLEDLDGMLKDVDVNNFIGQ